MTKEKNMLKIASFINCIIGILFLKYSFFGILLLITGIILFVLSKSDDKDFLEAKTVILVMGIICIPLNLIASIILFIVFDNLNNKVKLSKENGPPNVIYKVDNENKKIDLLLKLGVGMVFISGILFATTSWDFINDFIKAFVLIVMGITFMVLSIFTETKLKLYKSAYMYWILSALFFLLTIVGILYFGIFGNYLTYSGMGKYLAYFITYMTASGLVMSTYLKYPKKYLMYFVYVGLTIAIYNLLLFFELDYITVISIISALVFGINVIAKEDSLLFNYSKGLSLVLFAFIIINAGSAVELPMFAACIINIINLNYLLITKSNFEKIIAIIITYILIFVGIVPLSFFGDNDVVVVSLLASLYTLFINCKFINMDTFEKDFNYIIYSVVTIISFIVSCYYNNVFTVIISIIFIIVNELARYGLFNTEQIKASSVFEPLSILLLICSIQINAIDHVNFIYALAISSMIYCAMNYFYDEDFDKKVYFVYAVVAIIISVLFIYKMDYVYASMFAICSSLYLFSKMYLKPKNVFLLIISYLLLLSSIYFPFILRNIMDLNILYMGTGFIVLIALIITILKNDAVSKISYFYIVLPLLTIISSQTMSSEIMRILISSLILYVVFLIVKFFAKGPVAKNTVGIIGVTFALFDIFFSGTVVTGIFVGVVGLLVIIIGYRHDELSLLFKYGIGLTIVNIIYQLRDLWSVIPFWLYLLVGGLSIIGFVTYKEVKKQNNK